MEWGCMQALIDFDGWRKWKDFSQQKTAEAEAGEDKKNSTLVGLAGKGKGKKSGNNRVHSRTPSGAGAGAIAGAGGGADNNRVKEKAEGKLDLA